MGVKIIGANNSPGRIQTHLYSLDHAFINRDGVLGIPVGVAYEIFGLTSTGKSTFVYSLAAIIGKALAGDIALGDFEGFDDIFLTKIVEHNAFSGRVFIASEKDDEAQLDELIDLVQKKCVVGILDSIGAIAPMGEIKGEIGESNMGRRAFLLAQFSRKVLKIFRFNKNRTILMINHWYPKLGGYGYDTPGGEAKKYIASVRIKLVRDKIDSGGETAFPDGSYVLQGTIVKNRWGYTGRQFYVFMLAGYGLDANMTAVWDCYRLKLVKKSRGSLVWGEENLGKMSQLVRAAKEGKDEVFQPFHKLLGEYHEVERDEEESSDESNSDVPKSDEDPDVDD